MSVPDKRQPDYQDLAGLRGGRVRVWLDGEIEILEDHPDVAGFKAARDLLIEAEKGAAPSTGNATELQAALTNIARSKRNLKFAVTEQETREDLKGTLQMATAHAKQNLHDDLFALLDLDLDAVSSATGETDAIIKACRDLHVYGTTPAVVGRIVAALSAYDNR